MTEFDSIRVLICDDSAIVRAALNRIITAEPGINVAARAANGADALAIITARLTTAEPIDVLVLDLEMPVMDGITALPLLLQVDPALQVLISSATTKPGARTTMQALGLGAADFLTKPSAGAVPEGLPFERVLTEKISGLGRLRRGALTPPRGGRTQVPSSRFTLRSAPPRVLPPELIVIGSSTGGPQALIGLISHLGCVPVPVVVAQHMPAVFTPLLADHIATVTGQHCVELRDGMTLQPGRAYVAPGGQDVLLERSGAGSLLRAAVSLHAGSQQCRPSIDALLHSAAVVRPGRAIVVMLTGMGRDGLDGTAAVVAGGGMALAQDEASSVVWGMPGAIAKAGLCEAVQPPAGLAHVIRAALGLQPVRSPAGPARPGQLIAPRAVTGHRQATLSPRMPTIQS